MTKDELQKKLQELGFVVSNSNSGKWSLENEETLFTVQYQLQFRKEHMITFSLEGKRPCDEVLDAFVTYYESNCEGEINFKTNKEFAYYHSRYYYSNGILREHIDGYYRRTNPFYKNLYDVCVDEWKNDPLFSFDYFIEGSSFVVDLVKAGKAEQFSFKHKNEETYEMNCLESQIFSTQEECIQAFKQCLTKIEKSQRLPNVYQPSSYYVNHFFLEMSQGDKAQAVFDHLCQTYDWEEVEAYFRSLTPAQVNRLNINPSLQMIELMDTLVIFDQDEVAFYQLDAFDEALAHYKTCLFARVSETTNVKRWLTKHGKGEQI